MEKQLFGYYSLFAGGIMNDEDFILTMKNSGAILKED